jgi:hypothetical protein
MPIYYALMVLRSSNAFWMTAGTMLMKIIRKAS